MGKGRKDKDGEVEGIGKIIKRKRKEGVEGTYARRRGQKKVT